ncbi:MAG TPA: hypothetical protein PKD91_03975 [Bacteroidia bacterium]|mgnify:CR=1 FL=1|nr:hypothetical protein [Bacteroidia bacterium]
MGRRALRNRQTMKTMNKMVFAVAGASLLGLAAYFTFFINTTSVTTSKAGLHKNMMLGYDINNGDVIAAYDWDSGDLLKAVEGPDAISVSKEAKCIVGGTENTKGLSPGKSKEPLNFEIPAVKEINLGGIDMSVDYRKSEDNCELFTRGNHFTMGVKDGKLAISYKLKNKDKKNESVSEVTRYEIPADDEFRNYRFVYDPIEGRSEIFVNHVAIWSHDSDPESVMLWKEKDNLIVGKNLKGDGSEKVFIDNVLIKATRQISEMPVTLLNFEARAENNYVMVSWYTASESEIDSFIVERSMDAKDFMEVGRLKATGGQDKLTAYAVVDKSPNTGLAYYRLVPSNKPLKSMTISMIGYKYKGNDGDLKLSDVKQPEETKK